MSPFMGMKLPCHLLCYRNKEKVMWHFNYLKALAWLKPLVHHATHSIPVHTVPEDSFKLSFSHSAAWASVLLLLCPVYLVLPTIFCWISGFHSSKIVSLLYLRKALCCCWNVHVPNLSHHLLKVWVHIHPYLTSIIITMKSPILIILMWNYNVISDLSFNVYSSKP